MGPIAVIGATGKQGGATARRLLADGHEVRALVRDPGSAAAQALADRGATLVVGDLDDPPSLDAAFRESSGVFAVPPVAHGPAGTDVDHETRRGRAVAAAAAAAGVDHVVFSGIATVTGDLGAERGKLAIERVLRDEIDRVTVLRPARFLSNYLASGDAGIEGVVDGVHRHVFPPDVPVQVIDVDDVGWFAAAAFGDPDRYAGRTLELAGDAPTPRRAAAMIAEATGRPVRYRQLDEPESSAIGPEIAEIRAQWQAGEGWHADIEALRVVHPGLRTFGQWLAEGGADALRAG